MTKKIEGLSKENENLNTDVSNLSSAVLELTEKLSSTLTELAHLKRDNEIFVRSLEKNNENALQQLQAENNETIAQLKIKYEAKINQINENNEIYIENIRKVNEINKTLEKENDIENEIIENDNIHEGFKECKCTEYLLQIEKQSEEISNLGTEVQKAETVIRKLILEIDAKETEAAENFKSIEQLSAKLKALPVQFEPFHNTDSSVDTKTERELECMRSQITDLTFSNKEKSKRIDQLLANLTETQDTIDMTSIALLEKEKMIQTYLEESSKHDQIHILLSNKEEKIQSLEKQLLSFINNEKSNLEVMKNETVNERESKGVDEEESEFEYEVAEIFIQIQQIESELGVMTTEIANMDSDEEVDDDDEQWTDEEESSDNTSA
ncbi:hypothetical protein HK096_009730 [Nowakowskiella sp. JEL0078]|nr:hypothetical protein HK096_009730 [Nowakowskiella sp. JEL0078]